MQAAALCVQAAADPARGNPMRAGCNPKCAAYNPILSNRQQRIPHAAYLPQMLSSLALQLPGATLRF